MNYYAVLNLNSIFISLDELSALLNDSIEITYLSGVALFDKWKDGVSRRSATIKRAGKIILISDNEDNIINELKGQCFSINLDSIYGIEKEKLLNFYNKLKENVKLSRKCKTIDILLTDNLFIIGEIIEKKDYKSILRHSLKPYSQSGTMDPMTSRLLVNLSRPKNIVYDPFAGMGSILIESKWLGYECVGSDINEKMLMKAKENLKFFNYECELFQASATQKNLRRVESIVTDPPYGMSSLPKGYSLKELYERFFYTSIETLDSNGYLVFASGDQMDWRDSLKEAGFKKLRLHYLYLHKSLSRVIYVVRK
jgi:tRNA (guanine10-N2)-dimethyltransferase